MKDSEKVNFDKALFALAEVYRITLSPAQVAGYWELLNDLSFNSFSYAVRLAGQSCKFFPVPAEIRTYAKDYHAPQDLSKILGEGKGVPMPEEIKKKLERLYRKQGKQK